MYLRTRILNVNQTFRGYCLFISDLKATEKSGALKFLCSKFNFPLPFTCIIVIAQHSFFGLWLRIPRVSSRDLLWENKICKPGSFNFPCMILSVFSTTKCERERPENFRPKLELVQCDAGTKALPVAVAGELETVRIKHWKFVSVHS